MATDISICSNALQMLGDQAIAAFTDDSTRAPLAGNLYPAIRDAVLRSHPWNCAVKRVVLSPDATAPAYDYTAQFILPGDWLRTLSIGQDGEEVDYRMESGLILANESVIYLRYIFQNKVEATWDSMLVQAMTLGMAAALAYPITASTALADSLNAQYVALLRAARSVDGQDNPPETLGDFPLYASRFSGGAGW